MPDFRRGLVGKYLREAMHYLADHEVEGGEVLAHYYFDPNNHIAYPEYGPAHGWTSLAELISSPIECISVAAMLAYGAEAIEEHESFESAYSAMMRKITEDGTDRQRAAADAAMTYMTGQELICDTALSREVLTWFQDNRPAVLTVKFDGRSDGIAWFAYDPDQQILSVHRRQIALRDGGTTEYANVPPTFARRIFAATADQINSCLRELEEEHYSRWVSMCESHGNHNYAKCCQEPNVLGPHDFREHTEWLDPCD